MTPEQLNTWRRDMHSRLDALAHSARVTRQSLEAQNLDKLADTAEFRALWMRIVDLFPEEFTPERAGDLARHIHFAMPHDFYDIEHHDIPAIKASVDRYKRGGEENAVAAQNELLLDFETFELVHPLIRDVCLLQFRQRHYEIAARSAIEFVMDEIRRLSGQQGDGGAFINGVFGRNVGQLRFSEGDTDNDRMISRGLKGILTGCYTGVRNPLAHGGVGFSKIECFQVLVLCSFLLARISVVPGHENEG